MKKPISDAANVPLEDEVKKTAPHQRGRISQSDIPSYSLEQALRVARTIADNYAYKSVKPLDVAAGLEMSPTSGTFRMLCGAALAYGVTTASYGAPEIGLTPLGLRIVRPLEEGDDIKAKREAMLMPRIFAEFLNMYNNAQLPKSDIAKNVLLSMGVPADRVSGVFDLLIESAASVGVIRSIKDKSYVDLQHEGSEGASEELHIPRTQMEVAESMVGTVIPRDLQISQSVRETNNRVFITHGKNLDIVNQLKELLSFGQFTAVVAAEHETVSKPVPDKVLDDMRSCYAAIIHVGQEKKLLDAEGKEHIILNQNVLVEIGAAMALYNRRFILLVERGATLPSNLQGLYEVRYDGAKLDYDATMKLLKAFNDFKL